MKVTQTHQLGSTGVTVTGLGLGCASFGGLYAPMPGKTAAGILRAAWDAGVRHFDAAPMYGLGRAEHLLGHFLREEVEAGDDVVISTKVGRLMTRERPGRPLPAKHAQNPFDTGWDSALAFQEVFDYSYDAIMRSFDDSQQRLGLADIDLLYVHDIGRVTHAERHDHHWAQLTTGRGFRALAELRDAGIIKGFGLGVNECEVIEDAMSEADLDCCLLAGRYSLLDQSAETLFDKAQAAGVSFVLGGVFNSGILAGGPSKFNYVDAPQEIIDRVAQMTAVCAEFGVPLGAAAIQFPMRHAAVSSVMVGAGQASDVTTNVGWFEQDIPEDLWAALFASAA